MADAQIPTPLDNRALRAAFAASYEAGNGFANAAMKAMLAGDAEAMLAALEDMAKHVLDAKLAVEGAAAILAVGAIDAAR